MSHLVETTTNFTRESYIKGALKKMGVNETFISTYRDKQAIRDYYGNVSNKKANLIVKKGAISGTHSDVGFEQMENGTYKVHYDGMDKNWMQQLTQSYSQVVVEDQLDQQGFSLEKVENTTGEMVMNFIRWR